MNDTQQTLRYAHDKGTNKIINITDVVSGLACNCICIACGSILVAHKGKKKAHHFKHYQVDACVGGVESAIHYKAKEIIANAKHIKLPGLTISHYSSYKNEFVHILPKPIFIELDDICIEKQDDEIRPDLIAWHKGRKLLIEIAVTHFIGDTKKAIIRKQGVSCIEIDLSELHKSDRNISDKELLENIINSVDNKKWIHNSKYQLAYKSLREKINTNTEKRHQEEKERKKQEKIDNDNYEKTLVQQFTQNKDSLYINEHEILCRESNSNRVDFTIFGMVLTNAETDYTISLEFEINVDSDDSSMFFNDIKIEDTFISNDFLLPIVEKTIEEKLNFLSKDEGLYNWLKRRVKENQPETMTEVDYRELVRRYTKKV